MVDRLFLLPIKNRISILFFVMLLPALLALSCAPQPAGLTPSPVQKSPELDWLSIPLKDVMTEKPFKLSDFRGKVVIVETMAVWCTTCTRQQIEIKQAKSRLGNDVISVSLDIDPNENEAILKKHAQSNGFDWTFAVSPPSLSQEMARMFGETILNSTATPVIILGKDQSAHPLRFGLKNSQEIAREVGKYL